jgi:membrane protein YdbS with pleckstrin-like domain
MRSQIAAELVGANPGPAVHLAVLGVIVVIGLVIFALTRWRKRREGLVEDELPTQDISVANKPRTEATHPAREQDPPHR